MPHNPHVIRVHGIWSDGEYEKCNLRTFILMEFCDGTLASYLNEKPANADIEPRELLQIMIQLLHGLVHCHSRDVCHRDLKPSNSTIKSFPKLILVLFIKKSCSCHGFSDYRRCWLLADFGFSAILKNSESQVSCERRGTPGYRAPELADCDVFDSAGVYQPGVVSKKSDIWSLGCILFQLATTNKACAFDSDNQVVAFKNGYCKLPLLNKEHNKALKLETICPQQGCLLPFWEQINSILKVCLAQDPGDRPTADQLLISFNKMWFGLVEAK